MQKDTKEQMEENLKKERTNEQTYERKNDIHN